MSTDEPRPPFVQAVTAVNGFAYGVIGADIHVFSNGLPLYLLGNWVAESATDADWLREMPSRMLNSHHAVVPFTGRDAELADLRQWRDSGPRLAIRWSHGPGGQGKTRLAAHFAAECAQRDWKVIAAFHGPDADRLRSGAHDMTLSGQVGLLVIVDYADRWLTTNLTWLFKNSLLHHADVAVRVLMLARTVDSWPAIRGILDTYQASTSSQFLPALPQDSAERGEMFDAARNSFAALYRRPGPSEAGPSPAERPECLMSPEFGLILAVHMLALVTVDGAATGRAPPTSADGLTVYLLDRELLHWARLYGHRTPPEVMNRVVFAAALTGTVSPAMGSRILADLDVPDPEQTLLDHAFCYPPSGPDHDNVFEPIYPDRLAEDFIALTLPGHRADYPAKDWAPGALAFLLARDGHQHAAPTWVPRAMTFLAAAAARWPHLCQGYLQPVLRDDPQLALDAGSGALAAISELTDIESTVLDAIEARLPEHRVLDLDVGIAALAKRLAGRRLAELDIPRERAAILHDLGVRLSAAGSHDQAVTAFEDAIEIQRPLAGADISAFGATLAGSLSLLGGELWELGRREESLAAANEAVRTYSRLAAADPGGRAALGMALNNQAIAFLATARPRKAVAVARRAVVLYRTACEADSDEYLPDLATALTTLSAALAGTGRPRKALAAAQEAISIRRPLAAANPSAYQADLATSLSNLGTGLAAVHRLADGLAAAREAVELWRHLAEVNAAAHEANFAASVDNLAMHLWELGRREDSAAANQEAVDAYRLLARHNPATHDASFASSLFNLGGRLLELGHPDQALSPAKEAAAILRRLADDDPAAHDRDFAESLDNLAKILTRLGHTGEAAATEMEGASAYRRLSRSDPAANLPELAHTLSNLGAHLSHLEKWQDAHAVTQEAVVLYRELAKAHPAVHTSGLARTLFNLARMQAGLDRPEEAIAAGREAVARYRRLARRDPAAYEPRLAAALENVAIELGRLGRREQALGCAREAASLRNLAGDPPCPDKPRSPPPSL